MISSSSSVIIKGGILVEPNDLIKLNNSKPECVVLVGNGAIENGWTPLREALDPMINNKDGISDVVKNIKVQNCETFHQLAILSYRFKLYRAQILRKLVEGKLTLQELEKKGLDPVVYAFLKLRTDIANSYKKYEKELSLKISSDIKALIGENAFFITTNWDETLWNMKEIKNLAYLHGRSSLPQSIVFPTELLIDDTMFDPMTLKGYSDCPEEFKNILSEVFRFKAIGQLMDTIEFACSSIKEAKRIVVWGFNLADYDADINTLLSTNTHNNQELVVINPDFTAFARAVGLTNITNARHYNPSTELCLKLETNC